MITVALTGGMGSGKSTVARLFRLLGVPVFEADAEARRLQDHDTALRNAIAHRFGDALYAEGMLDRQALAAIVFADAKALADLNAMVHPAVRSAFRTWAATHSDRPYVIMEAAVLVRSGGHRDFDRTLVVEAPKETRIQRVLQRDGSTREQVLARMANQASDAELHAAAHHLVDNSGAQAVIPQVLDLHATLSARS
ncbi:MAG: dephospho-CoA kinase [Flavobacteriales bacterium]